MKANLFGSESETTGAAKRFLRGGMLVIYAALTLLLGSVAQSQILWEGDPALGSRAFEGVEKAPGFFISNKVVCLPISEACNIY